MLRDSIRVDAALSQPAALLRAAALVALSSGGAAQTAYTDFGGATSGGATTTGATALANETSVANWGPLVPGAECSAAPSANVRYLHGAWMAVSWSTLIAAGVFVARYCRHKPWWMTVHIQLMTIGSLGTAGFAAVAVAMVQPERQGLSAHHILGLTIGVLTLAQASAGKYVHQLHKNNREHGLGSCLTACHKILGKLLLTVAAYEIWLGLDMLVAALTKLFLGWFAVLVAVFTLAEARLHLCPTAMPAADDDVHDSGHAEARHAQDREPEPEPAKLEPRDLELDSEVQMTDNRSPQPHVGRRAATLPRVPPPISAVPPALNGQAILSRVPPPLNGVRASA